MKKLFRTLQGIGFVLVIVGAASIESSMRTSIYMIVVGGIFLYGFAKLEKGYYFEKEKGYGN